MINIINLRRKKKWERAEATKKVHGRIRELMLQERNISVERLVQITEFSEYMVAKIYMKVRRELS